MRTRLAEDGFSSGKSKASQVELTKLNPYKSDEEIPVDRNRKVLVNVGNLSRTSTLCKSTLILFHIFMKFKLLVYAHFILITRLIIHFAKVMRIKDPNLKM